MLSAHAIVAVLVVARPFQHVPVSDRRSAENVAAVVLALAALAGGLVYWWNRGIRRLARCAR